jgi:hypothetical protein
MTATPTLADPAALTPGQWSARLAAYLGRGRTNDAPDVIACRQALSYWRCRRVIDAEVGRIGAAGVEDLVDTLLQAHSEGLA